MYQHLNKINATLNKKWKSELGIKYKRKPTNIKITAAENMIIFI